MWLVGGILWNDEYPIKLKDRFGILLEGVENYNHYLIEQEDEIIAWAVEFEKEHEKRFSIIVKNEHKGKGYGKLLINRLKIDLGEFYGWVIDHNNDLKQNGEFYKSPIDFYLKNGFEVLREERIDSEIINAVKIKNNVKILAETERLILRELDYSDKYDLFEMDADPEVHLYIENNPVKSIDEITKVIEMLKKQYAENGIARWAVVDKLTNEFVGWSGLKYFNQPLNNHNNFYELGYRFKRKHWGKGFATESSTAILDYGFENLNIEQIFAMTDPKNANSKKVLAKLGFDFEETFDYDGDPIDWFKLSKATWENKKRNFLK
jgi:[ribosomal protein S5]-alanine N-acetyltransferase